MTVGINQAHQIEELERTGALKREKNKTTNKEENMKTYNIIIRVDSAGGVQFLQGEVELQVRASSEEEAEKAAYDAVRGACLDVETIEEDES